MAAAWKTLRLRSSLKKECSGMAQVRCVNRDID
jgi:hypothetical protein